MRKILGGAVSLLAAVFLVSSNLPASPLQVVEGTSKEPHEKVAEIEVSVRTDGRVRPQATKAQLIQKLIEKAKTYHADAISEVKFYPSLEQPTFFRYKEYYARGTLIQYRKFPEAPKK